MEFNKIKNGTYNKIEKIQEDVGELRTSLTEAIKELSAHIQILTVSMTQIKTSIDNQTSSQEKVFQIFSTFYQKSVPVKLVFLMFLIIIGVIFGKETIEWIFNHNIIRNY